MVYSVNKIPIFYLIILFIIYLVLHYFIGIQKQKAEKKYKESSTLENEKNIKLLTFFFRWFPAIYVILLLLFFYAI